MGVRGTQRGKGQSLRENEVWGVGVCGASEERGWRHGVSVNWGRDGGRSSG